MGARFKLFDLPEFRTAPTPEHPNGEPLPDPAIAKIIGVNKWTVGRVRNGINRPGKAFMRKAERATGRSFDEFFEVEGDAGAVPALQSATAVP